MNYEAAIWIGLALLAALISVRISMPVALVEIVVGALAGNLPGIKAHVTETDVVTFLVGVGSIVLTFLAGRRLTRCRSGGTGRPAYLSGSSRSPCRFWPPSPSATSSWAGIYTPPRSVASPCQRHR